jgi:23S rRNA pseudouridine1911/1915/1917 synthase
MTTHFNIKVPLEMAGYRLDKALAELLPDYSRARLQEWIQQGQVLVNSNTWRGKDKVQGGEAIQVIAELQEEVAWQAQPLPLTLLYEDDDILIIDKPAGLVVHPGAGNSENTLVNALLHHAPELAQLPRAGIIHRLDKDTSGVLVVARSLPAHTSLVAQLQQHQFMKQYQAIVNGVLIAGDTVQAPIGRHPTQRTKMAVVTNGKPATTHYRVKQRFRAHTHIEVQLETGRTHQIRVHLAYKHYPIVGDHIYGYRPHLPPHCQKALQEILQTFPRQALHASQLGFHHPTREQWMQWQIPLPTDMQNLLQALQQDKQQYA